jgi:hypothetical protein
MRNSGLVETKRDQLTLRHPGVDDPNHVVRAHKFVMQHREQRALLPIPTRYVLHFPAPSEKCPFNFRWMGISSFGLPSFYTVCELRAFFSPTLFRALKSLMECSVLKPILIDTIKRLLHQN